MDFSARLIKWYNTHKRDLPWRRTRDPYKVWLSEIILQQTRVDQGMSYYLAFTKAYPTVMDLAAAHEDQVLKLWQGLGYYSRARNLHGTARLIATRYKGQFPPDYKGLLALKGVGDYTAAAISSICYDEAQPVVDGNVYRVLSRFFGLATPIDSTQGKKEFRELAAEVMDKKHAATYNQAVMEFGALQCVPKNPDCGACPLAASCEALRTKRVGALPVKAKKAKQTDRFFHYLVMHHKGKVYLRQRTGKDIWKGLFDFPLIETKEELPEAKLATHAEWKKLLGKTKHRVKQVSAPVKHVLSHQRLHVRFVEVILEKPLPAAVSNEWSLVPEHSLGEYAVPILVHNYLEAR